MKTYNWLISGLLILAVSACGSDEPGELIEGSEPIAMIAVDGEPTYADVVSAQLDLRAGHKPADVEVLRAADSCKLPEPSKYARVYVADMTSGRGKPGVGIPLHVVRNEGELPEMQMAVNQVKKALKKPGLSRREKTLVRERWRDMVVGIVDPLRRVDVIVTDTDKPVFLWLQGHDVAWNIQTAPGVEIEGVVVWAGQRAALLNGPKLNKVGFVKAYSGRSGRCGVKANEWRDNSQNVSAAERSRKIREMQRTDFAFSKSPKMFLKKRRQDVEILDLSKQDRPSAVLAGPIPDALVQHAPVNRILIPSPMLGFWGTEEQAERHFSLDI